MTSTHSYKNGAHAMSVEYTAKADRSQGNWYPACNGTETPFKTRGGHTLLYCWQPSTGNHAYLNVETDMLLSDDEARATLALY